MQSVGAGIVLEGMQADGSVGKGRVAGGLVWLTIEIQEVWTWTHLYQISVVH